MIKRVAIGVYSDGFIHAGNLAYLALLSLFPFVIVAAALARLFGQGAEGMDAANALLVTMPPDVADVLRTPIDDVLQARHGNLLWLGALVGLWTAASFIETIRDIIRRAYGVSYSRPFWEYRLCSRSASSSWRWSLAMIAFSASILLSGAQKFVVDWVPGAADIVGLLTLLQVAPALVLFGSLYLLFYILTPKRYRGRSCRKWPGAAFVALWWVATTALLPVALVQPRRLRHHLWQPRRRDDRADFLLRYRARLWLSARSSTPRSRKRRGRRRRMSRPSCTRKPPRRKRSTKAEEQAVQAIEKEDE